MQGQSRDKIRLQLILDSIIEVETYTLNTDLTGFLQNSMMKFACVKQLEIIGEAGNHISDDTKAGFSTIEWSQIIGMRNVFVHEYFGIDSKVVWDIIKDDLPGLKSKITEILNSI
jgi:uncharacterized protein with HEPN domain